MKQFKMILNEVSYNDALEIFRNNAIPIYPGKLNKDKHLALRHTIIFDEGIVHIANSKQVFEDCPFTLLQWQQFLNTAVDGGWSHVRESASENKRSCFKMVLPIKQAYHDAVAIFRKNGYVIHEKTGKQYFPNAIIVDGNIVYLTNTKDDYESCPFPELNYGEFRFLMEDEGAINPVPSPVEEKTYTKRDVDFAYLLGVMSVGGMDGLDKELKRLLALNKNPSDIIDGLK